MPPDAAIVALYGVPLTRSCNDAVPIVTLDSTLNGLVLVGEKPAEEATSVYVPGWLIVRLPKAATPFEFVSSMVVPPRVPPPMFSPRATLIATFATGTP